MTDRLRPRAAAAPLRRAGGEAAFESRDPVPDGAGASDGARDGAAGVGRPKPHDGSTDLAGQSD
ncbi:hypothetical protein LP52_14345 [Streptomonospora alba]|uniref:Uncharacterized protein n=1 Tax=Streptomonospora alba TaxID=183763 RepID=A0A0C2JHE8_9ACTN|nr:hypothetical protein LP52_14345 [Streptomonospora alba]